MSEGAALSGAGKRAAFALFYGPLHYLLVREIVTRLSGAADLAKAIVDLGCGTGAAGAAWASACARSPTVTGIDRRSWALEEARLTYRAFGLSARTRLGDITTTKLPEGRAAFLAAFALNELTDAGRDVVMGRLLERATRGDRLLIVEPLAGFVAPWWDSWSARVEAAGGRADRWRFRVELPPIVRKLDRAAGLDHRELTGRSLWL